MPVFIAPTLNVAHISMLIRFQSDREFFSNLSATRKAQTLDLLAVKLMEKNDVGAVFTSNKGLDILQHLCATLNTKMAEMKVNCG